MGKAKWSGVAAAVAIAIVIVVVLVTRGVFTGSESTDPTPDADGSSAESAPEQDSGVEVGEDMQREASVSGDAVDAATVASPGDDQDAEAADREDADVVTVAAPGDAPDAGAADREGMDAPAGSHGSATTVDSPQSAVVEESGQAPDEALQSEAETFVRELAGSSGEPVPADGVEGFMGSDRTLSSILPGREGADRAAPATGTADEPEDEPAAEPEAAAESGAPGAQPENTRSATASVPRAEDADTDGADTVQPQSSTAEAGDLPVSDATETTAGDAREARVDLPLSEEAPVTIAELLGAEDAVASDAVFYVHTVRPDDDLGIWGIVHDGITENFAEGVAVHRGETVETYRVDIPSDADQLDADQSSSFLGKIIYDKSQMTYVYNYRTDRLGRNPDMIMPGQEIVIVSFTPEELIEIYKYFARDR